MGTVASAHQTPNAMRTILLPLIIAGLFAANSQAQDTANDPIALQLTTAVHNELGALNGTTTVQCTMAQWHTGTAGTGSALVMHRAPRVWAGASCTWLSTNNPTTAGSEVVYVTATDANEAVEALAARIAERLRRPMQGPQPDTLQRELARGN